jgi:hypothetical protein
LGGLLAVVEVLKGVGDDVLDGYEDGEPGGVVGGGLLDDGEEAGEEDEEEKDDGEDEEDAEDELARGEGGAVELRGWEGWRS